MQIEHSQLLNDFLSFWFETRIDGVLRFETILNCFPAEEWYTCPAGEGTVLLRGDIDSALPDAEALRMIKLEVEQAITTGRIPSSHSPATSEAS
jgi:hypothetical protein